MTLAGATLLLLTGCGTADVLTMEPARAPDVGLVAGAGGGMDFAAADSPEHLIDLRAASAHSEHEVKVIVTGAVESIEQGRNIYTDPEMAQIDRLEPAHRHIVLKVKVDETLRSGEPGDIHDGRVYIEHWQGGGQDTADGGYKPWISLTEWREAIPAGTRVMLFLIDAYDGKGQSPTEQEGRGLPDGANLLQPDPQGLIFEYDGQLVVDDPGGSGDIGSQWGVSSIAEISERVRVHLDKLGG